MYNTCVCTPDLVIRDLADHRYMLYRYISVCLQMLILLHNYCTYALLINIHISVETKYTFNYAYTWREFSRPSCVDGLCIYIINCTYLLTYTYVISSRIVHMM